VTGVIKSNLEKIYSCDWHEEKIVVSYGNDKTFQHQLIVYSRGKNPDPNLVDIDYKSCVQKMQKRVKRHPYNSINQLLTGGVHATPDIVIPKLFKTMQLREGL
jgi:hypothetical protein